jgi:transposase InsO family protein
VKIPIRINYPRRLQIGAADVKPYLAAVVDWFSRKVLACKLSITLETEYCFGAVEEALARYGKPEIFNADQGPQFTSIAFAGPLLKNEIKISMDGKGAWRDNIFVERLWRTIKYEEVYLRAYASVQEGRASISRYIDAFYNARRLIRALTGRRRMRLTSQRYCQSRLQHNHGRNPLSRSHQVVQTNRASSHIVSVHPHIFEIWIVRERLEHAFPHALLRPTPEARVDGEPFAEFGW